MHELLFLVATFAQERLEIGPTHLFYKVTFQHDTAWWSMVAALASAATAILSLGAGIIATMAAQRSAEASELSYLRATCPTFSLWISGLPGQSHATLNAKNLGPGSAESVRIWPAATKNDDFEYRLPTADDVMRSQFSFGPHVEPGQTRTFTLEDVKIGGPTKSYVLEWDDAAGNRGQTWFTVWELQQIGLHPFINGKVAVGPYRIRTLRRRREALRTFLKFLPKQWFRETRKTMTVTNEDLKGRT